MTGAPVSVDGRRHGGQEVRPDHAAIPMEAVLPHLGLDPAADPGERDHHRALDVEQAELVLRQEVERARHVAPAGLARLAQVLHVERRGVPRDERAVEVEERCDRH